MIEPEALRMRCLLLVSSLLVLFVPSAHGIPQTAAASRELRAPAFQVATIKPSTPDESLSLQIRGRIFATTASSLVDLMQYAYSVHASQIAGGPEWVSSRRFDIVADPETTERPSSAQFKSMVQQLVAERFHLVTHGAMRELPVYALTVAKGGPRLTPSTRDANSIPAVSSSPSGKFMAGNASMRDIAAFLQRFALDRPVVDQTGLPGRYDISHEWNPDDLNASEASTSGGRSNALPGLYTAFQEQLGLKLVATKAVVEVLVVDHVEQPSEN